MRPLWIKAAVALVLIWALAGGVVWWVRSIKPTPESLVRYVSAHPVDGRSPAQREKVLVAVAEQLNQLPYDERRDFRANKRLESFYKSLKPGEQSRFLDLTVPAGMKQMMEAFNKLTPEKRKEMVERASEQIRKHQIDVVEPNNDDPNVKRIIEHGLQSFYSDASADTKLDFAPLIEQIQHNLQGLSP